MNEREMSRLAQDPSAVRALAKRIMKTKGNRSVEKMQKFLSFLSNYDGSTILTGSQKEALYSLREQISKSTKLGPYDARYLVNEAHQLQFRLHDYDYDNEDWLNRMNERGEDISLYLNERKRLIAICKEIGIIPRNEYIELN